jgi:hypothetical protein
MFCQTYGIVRVFGAQTIALNGNKTKASNGGIIFLQEDLWGIRAFQGRLWILHLFFQFGEHEIGYTVGIQGSVTYYLSDFTFWSFAVKFEIEV